MYRIGTNHVPKGLCKESFLREAIAPKFTAMHTAQSATRLIFGRKGAAASMCASATVPKAKSVRKNPKDVHFWTADDMPSQVCRDQSNVRTQCE